MTNSSPNPKIKVAAFSSKNYDRRFLDSAAQGSKFTFDYLDARLTEKTVALTKGYRALCLFVNDVVNESVLKQLNQMGVQHIVLRCAGFNNVDLSAAKKFNISVSRVPAYSPEAVAEHSLALMMTLNRKIHKAHNRVRENNFSLDGLLGFNFKNKQVGIIGTGKIGASLAKIMLGLGCSVVCYDPYPSQDLVKIGCQYQSLDDVFSHSDIISLHCPLTDDSFHMVNHDTIATMKQGVMLINTSRGALTDAKALIQALKSKKIGYLGLDVYEMESELFFEDLSSEIIQDDIFDRLTGFPNVVITGHQGFFTHEALVEIAHTTLHNLNNVFGDNPTKLNRLC